MRKHLLIIILTLFVLPSFSGKKPKTIDEAAQLIQKRWSKKDKETYKKLKEDDALAEMDNMDGVWIRNEWIRFCKDTTLRHSFHEMGITHADDMSDIILVTAYRKLNDLPIEIEAQVKKCKDYWTPVRECEEKVSIMAISNYDRFKVGDSITVYLYAENLVLLNGRTVPCPYSQDWDFDYKKDIIVRGTITEKYSLYGDPYFKVQVASVNPEQAHVFYKRVMPADVVEFPLKSLLVKQPPLEKGMHKKLDKTY